MGVVCCGVDTKRQMTKTEGQGQTGRTGFVRRDGDRQRAGQSGGGLEAEQAKMSNLSALQQLFNICRVPIRGREDEGRRAGEPKWEKRRRRMLEVA